MSKQIQLFLIFASLFLSCISLPGLHYEEETRFLTKYGFVHLIDNFKQEEVEIHHINRIDDNTLRELGVTTIGARYRLRDAAQEWLSQSVPPNLNDPTPIEVDEEREVEVRPIEAENVELEETEVENNGRVSQDTE